jgi:glycosyltransferase involved in cell wall biosynthesis
VRALVVTNMWPSERDPAFGSFVRDQVDALRAIDGVEVDVFAFSGGTRGYARAARALRQRHGDDRFDVIHAHFGLSAWPALALRGAPHVVTMHGTDLAHPRSGPVSRAAVPLVTLAATVSASLAKSVPGAGTRRRVAVLPCGVALDRFRPLDRAHARRRLGLDPDGHYLLFPADPARPGKRHADAAQAAGAVRLLTLGGVPPAEVPLYVNAANAVLITSESEGFGLALLEALACDVPVLSTPVGIAPLVLQGIEGTLCAPFDRDRWRAALAPHLAEADPRVVGRERAALFSAERMAQRVLAAWREVAGTADQQRASL